MFDVVYTSHHVIRGREGEGETEKGRGYMRMRGIQEEGESGRERGEGRYTS